MPHANFIETPGMPGEGRCRVCDLAYSRNLPSEVAGHRRFHAKYLQACDTFGAPIPERDRERYIAEGLELIETGQTLEDRVRGGKKWLLVAAHQEPRESERLAGGVRIGRKLAGAAIHG